MIMSLNKNKIFGYAALILALIGILVILLGVYKYQEYTIGFSVVGVGFIAVAWAFNALKGRI
jgi:tetrahydromethanopterin S-methyltransferase subunit C